MKLTDYPSTRKEARERGAKWYYLNKVCPRGHNNLRYVANSECIECRDAYWKKNAEEFKPLRRVNYNNRVVNDPIGTLLQNARNRCNRSGVEYNITRDDLTIPTHCPVLGIELVIEVGKRTDGSPSLDRIDSSKGYIKGNVNIISFRANQVKNSGTPEDHLRIYEYYKGKY